MSWADLLKSIVCVLNLIACVRLTGPYLIPKRSDREWSEARRRTDLYCRLAGWIVDWLQCIRQSDEGRMT